ncbi:alpha/beta fold hydrolase [Sinorhizobium meliloti]|jgi:pimeloyl-ACP methyl ester carboxylesterase|uniref:alpha/beta fold hydrolase n=1 Tax=Rhizobium meliloti TaxID=382 RepID=UPI001294E72A|nr:alpha/beta fold hydrolase [Sinorhizobium meliloti]MDW9594619.1 alpha/beta fold hydrolase [Sinorhizobium meliloti]MDX0190604.1 alpha/beta fold hydrolase [Sinorhizobium meliloti]MQV07677.1 alpha/beta fold hydrolase [Sinorhizobium meliloti]MQV10053.1 alpha/beta fold hydrolase [Sinorhizobium meliloti]MQV61714.1 alpha/beta fold hydrolase [Sinorhizobium meliloti]
MPSFAIKVIRLSLKAVSAFSADKAGKSAFWIFCRTPSRKPKNGKEAALLKAAVPIMQRSRKVTLSFAGGWAAARHFERRMGGRGPRVLVAHGWGSRSDYLATLIDGLLSSGAEVVALDLPGHGASPGRTLTMPQAVRAIDAAWRHFDGFDVGIGHSFGGASLACAAGAVLCDVPARVPGKLVLIGAPSEMTWLFRGFGRTLGLAPKAQAAFEGMVERLSGRRIEGFDATRILAALRKPVLVIHAEDDKEVPADHARRYGAVGPNVELHWANGLGHRRIVSAAPVIEKITEFLWERRKEAPMSKIA